MARAIDLTVQAAALVALMATKPAGAFEFQSQSFGTAYNRLAREAGVSTVEIESCPFDAAADRGSCIYDVGPSWRGAGTITLADGVFRQERAQSVTLRFKATSFSEFETSIVLTLSMCPLEADGEASGEATRTALHLIIKKMAGLAAAREQSITLDTTKIAVNREPNVLVAVITDTAYRERNARD